MDKNKVAFIVTILFAALGMYVVIAKATEYVYQPKSYRATCFGSTFDIKARSVKYQLAGGCLEFSDPMIYICGCNVLHEVKDGEVKK